VLKNPKLENLPVIVGGYPGNMSRGVVSAANYPARRYGVHSALSMYTARKLCPNGIFLPVDMQFYAKMSKEVIDIMTNVTPLVEQISIDEAYMDVKGAKLLFGSPCEVANKVKDEIQKQLGLTASIGVATNKFLAKMASNEIKPNGILLIPKSRQMDFIDSLEIEKVWGVGKQTAGKFRKYGVTSLKDIRVLNIEELVKLLGSEVMARKMKDLSFGVASSHVVTKREEKSISNETTFLESVVSLATLLKTAKKLTEKVVWRLKGKELTAKTVTVKLKDADFHLITRSKTMTKRTNSVLGVWETAKDLIAENYEEGIPIRLIGIGVSNFSNISNEQHSFEAAALSKDEQIKQAEKAVDEIKTKFSQSAIHFGA
jgi:DNA polymerase-4